MGCHSCRDMGLVFGEENVGMYVLCGKMCGETTALL